MEYEYVSRLEMTGMVEVKLLEGYSTMATWTLAREYIMIFWWETVYELVPGKGMFQTLGVEVQATMATRTLVGTVLGMEVPRMKR